MVRSQVKIKRVVMRRILRFITLGAYKIYQVLNIKVLLQLNHL